MLVLTRKQGEQIMVGDGIRLTVLAIEGKRVRLGLLAPRDVSILRTELGPPRKASKEARSPGTEEHAQ
jgi:carbon storage regulator